MDDKEILQLFAKTESRNLAFNHLVAKYQQKVYWLVRRMVIDHDDANDLTQEVFVRIWANLNNFRSEAGLYTWIYRIASNECLQFLNKKRKRFFLPLHDVEAELTNKLESGPLIDADELQMKFQKAILTLPEKQRMIFQLKYYEELKYEDISEITGTSVGALKASYHHAVKKLEVLINE